MDKYGFTDETIQVTVSGGKLEELAISVTISPILFI